MSLLGSIVGKILHPFGGGSADAAPAPTAGSGGSAGSSDPSTPSTAGAPGGEPVDVAAVLTGLAEKNSQTLDWRHSIVDLMKLLGMDSSLHARKELAGELHYTGDTDDSASMNIWLHKEVMSKFAANGGKLPADLQH